MCFRLGTTKGNVDFDIIEISTHSIIYVSDKRQQAASENLKLFYGNRCRCNIQIYMLMEFMTLV